MPIVEQQILLARRMYNDLIAEMRDAFRQRSSREIELGGERASSAAAQIEQLNQEFRLAKAAQDSDRMKVVASCRRALREEMRKILGEIRQTHRQELKTFLARIGRNSSCSTYKIRTQYVDEGLGWATANRTLDSALDAFQDSFRQGRAPSFSRGDEVTRDRLHLQFTVAGGVGVEALMLGRNPEIKLSPPAEGYGQRRYGNFKMRMGPASAGAWAVGTWQAHRQLPALERVAAVSLVRERVGPTYQWTLQFLVKLSAPLRHSIPAVRDRLATLHLGWARDDVGRQFCAIATGGDAAAAQLLHLPPDVEERLLQHAELQGTRDSMRDEIVRSLKGLADPPKCWPDEISEEFRAIVARPPSHIAPPRLHRFWLRLNELGLIDARLSWFSEWRKQDRLRHQHAVGLSRTARMRRRDFYRGLALEQCCRYECIAISSPNLTTAAIVVDGLTGERNELAREARAGRVVVALNEYVEALKWAATRCCTTLVGVGGLTVSECSHCASLRLADVEGSGHRLRTCLDCANVYDKKCNAAAVIFRKLSDKARNLIDDAIVQRAARADQHQQVKADRLQKVQSAARRTRARNHALIEKPVDGEEATWVGASTNAP